MTRSERFAAMRGRAVETFLGVSNPETRPTFCASDDEAITTSALESEPAGEASPPTGPLAGSRFDGAGRVQP